MIHIARAKSVSTFFAHDSSSFLYKIVKIQIFVSNIKVCNKITNRVLNPFFKFYSKAESLLYKVEPELKNFFHGIQSQRYQSSSTHGYQR